MKNVSTRRVPAGAGLLRLLVVGLASCAFAGCHAYFDCDIEIETRDGGHHVERARDGVSWTLDAPPGVEFRYGRIVSFPPGVVIRLTESRGRATRVAELREAEGRLDLWVQVDHRFERGTPRDEAWLGAFLEALPRFCAGSWKGPDAVLEEIRNGMAEGPLRPALRKLDDLPFSSDRARVLESIARETPLTPADQVAVVDAAFDRLSFGSEKRAVVLAVIRRPDCSPDARSRVRARIDELPFQSDKIAVLKALVPAG
jgi:hypothetical protein